MAHAVLSRGVPDLQRLQESLASGSYINGLTHDFYHYPARFSPEIARTIIELLSRPNDWVLDPFMGGGTSIVEGLAVGRRMIGVDINALAHFVTEVRTSPLSSADEVSLRGWLDDACLILSGSLASRIPPMRVHNMPACLDRFVSAALLLVGLLSKRRQEAFARCLILRLGQWALDCREAQVPSQRRLVEQLRILGEQMIAGLDDLAMSCRHAGVAKNKIRGRRVLLNRSSVGIDEHGALMRMDCQPKLVLTSPPYPGVHVLYHRWQYKGRRETAAPYHIAGLQDGSPASYYTAGSRTPTGISNYFETMEGAFSSVRCVIDPKAVVAQLVGFSDADTQVPRYEEMMERAGFEPLRLPSGEPTRIQRCVHNRKWYHRVRQGRSGSMEVLMLHRVAH